MTGASPIGGVATLSDHSGRSEHDVAARRTRIVYIAIVLSVLAIKSVLKPEMHSVYPTYANLGRVWFRSGSEAERADSAYVRIQYGPVFADIVAPFGLLPDRIGGALWTTVAAAMLFLGFGAFVRRVIPDASEHEILAGYALLPWCGLTSIYNGQANVLVAALLVWAIVFVADRRWAPAALCLALPVAIKVYPIAVACVMIALFPRPLFGRFLLSLIAIAAVPGLIHPWDALAVRYAEWFSFLASGNHYKTGFLLVDVRSFLTTWWLEFSIRDFMAVQAATAIAVAVSVFAAKCAGRDDRIAFAFSMASFWMVLFGPATEEATYLLAAPAVAWLLISAHRAGHGRGVMTVLAVLFAICGPLQTSLLGEAVRRSVLATRLAPVALLGLALFEIARRVDWGRVAGAPFTKSARSEEHFPQETCPPVGV